MNWNQYNSDLFKYKKGVLFTYKMAWIPLATEYQDTILIYFDNRISNQVKRFIKDVIKQGDNFLLVSRIMNNPKTFKEINENIHMENLRNMMFNYADDSIFQFFEKNNLDITKCIVDYINHFKCGKLFNGVYNDVFKIVNSMTYDHYTNKKFHRYPIEIRNKFDTLLRDVKIYHIIN